MSVRKRYVYRPDGNGGVDIIEISPDREPAARLEFSVDRHYEGLRATDGADISSRAKHREYMRINNLTTADDYKETWARAAEKRAEFFTKGGDAAESKARKEAIGRAMYELEKRGKR